MTLYNKKYQSLNAEQKLAVDNYDGPMMVIAGPGSGKSTLLTLRVANMIQNGVEPYNILCLTYTDIAAKNMQKKLVELVGVAGYKVVIGTYHSFCGDIMKRYSHYFDKDLTLVDDLGKVEILEEILEPLCHSNYFAKKELEGKFLYLQDCLNIISSFRTENISPSQVLQIFETNKAFYDKADLSNLVNNTSAVNKKQNIEAVEEILEIAKDFNEPYSFANFLLRKFEPLETVNYHKVFKDLLASENKEKQFQSKSNHARDVQIVQIYEAYNQKMGEKKLYDHDDTILRVIKALAKYPDLKLDVMESYQYILVDEFQDTNGAQFQILKDIVDPQNPNILCVGDDDQSIYKFQGASLENLKLFAVTFGAVAGELRNQIQFVTLLHNYRSSKAVVEISKIVAEQITTRATNYFEGIVKDFQAVQDYSAHLNYCQFPDKLQESEFIANKIEELIQKGVSPSEIAVVGVKRKVLQTVARLLEQKDISTNYPKSNKVLENPKILELVSILEYIDSLTDSSKPNKEDLLSEILQFEFWQISPQAIFELSDYCKTNNYHGRWSKAILSEKPLKIDENNIFEVDPKIKKVTQYLLNFAEKSAGQTVSAENILVELIGSPTEKTNENGDTELEQEGLSDFKNHYFDRYIKNGKATTETVRLLSCLNILMNLIREYKGKEFVGLREFVSLLGKYKSNVYKNLNLIDQTVYSTMQNGVSLLTAHGTKGLEFEVVFLIESSQAGWFAGMKGMGIGMPKGLNLSSKEDTDDFLRLFYVALTRCKKELYLTMHFSNMGETVKELEVFALIENNFAKKIQEMPTLEEQANLLIKNIYPHQNFVFELSNTQRMQEYLEKYVMSVTHLNNFLEVDKYGISGPRYFFEKNFLQFPSIYNISSAFGIAMHSVMQEIHNFHKQMHHKPSFDYCLEIFDKSLDVFHSIDKKERDKYRKEKGIPSIYYILENYIVPDGSCSNEVEVKNIKLGDARLAGKLDMVVIHKDLLTVVDFKTGGYKKKPTDSYKRQILFYEILLENSGRYSMFRLDQGELIYIEKQNISDGTVPILQIKNKATDLENLKNVIAAVWNRIQNLNFEIPENSTNSTWRKLLEQEGRELNNNSAKI